MTSTPTLIEADQADLRINEKVETPWTSTTYYVVVYWGPYFLIIALWNTKRFGLFRLLADTNCINLSDVKKCCRAIYRYFFYFSLLDLDLVRLLLPVASELSVDQVSDNIIYLYNMQYASTPCCSGSLPCFFFYKLVVMK